MILPLPCVILAGGKSSRMGKDKALLPFGSKKTLCEYQISKVLPWFKSLHVSTKSKDKFDFEAAFIEDTKEFDEFSPLVALYSILSKFQTKVALLSVDTPFVTKEVFEKLYKNSQKSEVTIAKSPFGTHQLIAIYSPKILPTLKEQIEKGDHKIRDTLTRVDTNYVDFSDDRLFTNLNRPDEYNEARKRA